jgi:hypothetical protein
MSTRIFLGGKGQPACKVDNITAICELIAKKMCEPQRLTTLWASTSCYRDSFTFYFPPKCWKSARLHSVAITLQVYSVDLSHNSQRFALRLQLEKKNIPSFPLHIRPFLHCLFSWAVWEILRWGESDTAEVPQIALPHVTDRRTLVWLCDALS